MVHRAHIDLLGVTVCWISTPLSRYTEVITGRFGEGRQFFQPFQTIDSRMHVCIRRAGRARSRLGPSPQKVSSRGLPWSLAYAWVYTAVETVVH